MVAGDRVALSATAGRGGTSPMNGKRSDANRALCLPAFRLPRMVKMKKMIRNADFSKFILDKAALFNVILGVSNAAIRREPSRRLANARPRALLKREICGDGVVQTEAAQAGRSSGDRPTTGCGLGDSRGRFMEESSVRQWVWTYTDAPVPAVDSFPLQTNPSNSPRSLAGGWSHLFPWRYPAPWSSSLKKN